MKKTQLSILTATILLAGSASATLLTNGSFETGTSADIGTNPNTSSIPGWTLQTSSGVTKYTIFNGGGGNEPFAANGTKILAIGGFGSTKGVALLWQDFPTTIGETYSVAFNFSRGNNDPAGTLVASLSAQIFDVISGSASGGAVATFDTGNAPATPATPTIATMVPYTFQFTATGTTTRLLLDDTSPSNGPGFYLDNASVTPVPEPSTAILALGGGFAFLLRRRPRVHA